MHYIVPIKKNLTLLYIVNGKKILLCLNSKKICILANKYLKNELSHKNKFYLLFKVIFNENNDKLDSIKFLQKDINIILDKQVRLYKDCKKGSLYNFDDFLHNKEKSGINILAGLVFDKNFINKIESNKELLKGQWCLLIGLENYYIFKISNYSCLECLQKRRLTNLPNIIENVIVEDYINKSRVIFKIKNDIFYFLNKFNFNSSSSDCIFIYDRNTKKIFKTKIIPFPDCQTCYLKRYNNVNKKYFIDERFGLLRPITTYVKKIGNIDIFISSTYISRVNALFSISINRTMFFKHILSSFKKDRNFSSNFSLFRPIVCGGVSIASKKIAEIKAFGEAIERYCATFVERKKILNNSSSIFSIEKNCPWILYSKIQYAHPKFPFSRLTSRSKISYVKGISVLNNKTRFVPASFVFVDKLI